MEPESEPRLLSPPAISPMRYYGGTARRSPWLQFRELLEYRELIETFAVRDLKVRYRQTIVGIAWAILQPVLTMVVFSLLFSMVNGKPHSNETPYAVTSLCGLVPWQLFAVTVVAATQSVVVNAQLIQKVYFPRIALPIASMIPSLVDFAIAMLVLLGMMLAFGVVPSWKIIFLPVFVAQIVAVSLSVSLWLSALNAIYRDVQYAVPFFVQIGMLASPVVYEMNAVVPGEWQWVYSLNPIAGTLEGFRWALLGTDFPALVPMLISLVTTLVLLVGGMTYFRRMERFFADRI